MKETTYQINIPASVALLGDLHGRPYQPVIDSLRKNKPQIIAIAGDIVSGYHPADGVSPLVSQKNILPFLEHCAAVAPAFLSLGNHEWILDEKTTSTASGIPASPSWTTAGPPAAASFSAG